MQTPCPRENVRTFQSCLDEQGQDFELVTCSARQATLRFTGPYKNQLIIWFMTLEALADGRGGLSLPNSAVRNYIEVGEDSATGRHIHVGLVLPLIDLPAIRKTITMVRNYKRLRPGRHEFGA